MQILLGMYMLVARRIRAALTVPCRQFLQSPYLFMQCTLQIDQPSSENPTPQVPVGQEITGQSVSSLHRLKDINNEGKCASASAH
jgi:hypothetical protein